MTLNNFLKVCNENHLVVWCQVDDKRNGTKYKDWIALNLLSYNLNWKIINIKRINEWPYNIGIVLKKTPIYVIDCVSF